MTFTGYAALKPGAIEKATFESSDFAQVKDWGIEMVASGEASMVEVRDADFNHVATIET